MPRFPHAADPNYRLSGCHGLRYLSDAVSPITFNANVSTLISHSSDLIALHVELGKMDRAGFEPAFEVCALPEFYPACRLRAGRRVRVFPSRRRSKICGTLSARHAHYFSGTSQGLSTF